MAEVLFFQHFEVERKADGAPLELGRGAMGVTYKAFDTNLRRPVCLKVINAASLHSETAQRRFVREARAVARVHHPNVATVFDLGRTGESYFYAMEFVEGETLDARIRRDGPLPAAAALRIAIQVARALGAAHREGLVHRDIKPANLMVMRPPPGSPEEDEDEGEGSGGRPRVKVIDFGLARAAGDDPEGDLAGFSASGIVGTPYFASPEQLEERPVDTRSDIYSLGVTLWFILTGQVPFSGSSVFQVVSQHLQRPPPFETLAGQPPELIAVLGRMLAKARNARPSDPFVLRRELETCLRTLPAVEAIPPKTTETVLAEGPSLSMVEAAETLAFTTPLTTVGSTDETLAGGWPTPPASAEPANSPPIAAPVEPPRRTGFSPLAVGAATLGGLLLAGTLAWFSLRHGGRTDAAKPLTMALENEATSNRPDDVSSPSTLVPSASARAASTPGMPVPEFTGTTPNSQTLSVPSRQFPTVRAALDAAQPGDTVALHAGVYEETLRFKDGVRLLGEGAERTILRVPAASGSVLVVQGCHAGQIALLGFEHTGAGRALSAQRPPAVLLEDSGVQLVRCRVRDAGGNGITLSGGDRSRVEGCEVSGANGSGIAAVGANTTPTLRENRLHDNRSHGLQWTEGAGGVAEANVCQQNAGAGLAVEGSNTSPTLRDNTASNNLTAGILYRRGAGGEARGNTIARNTGSGIDLAGADTAPTLIDNRCDENQAWGIFVQPPAAPRIAGDNQTKGNRVGGISTGR